MIKIALIIILLITFCAGEFAADKMEGELLAHYYIFSNCTKIMENLLAEKIISDQFTMDIPFACIELANRLTI